MMLRLAVPIMAVLLGPAALAAQAIPFAPGEQLNFSVTSSLGRMGTAVMRVDADTLRGRDVYRLAFDFNARVLLFSASDHTRSWIDPGTFTTMRYTKRERSPIGRRDEAVDVFAADGYWRTSAGAFSSATTSPQDELSFLYHVRQLPLAEGETYTLNTHFDPARNPVVIRVLRSEQVTVAPGRAYPTLLVEMRVRDARQKSGTSVLRLNLTQDARRIPVRIEADMPVGGHMVMTLQSSTSGQHSAPGNL